MKIGRRHLSPDFCCQKGGESESAADDRVLSMGVPRTQYATHLVELLRDLNNFPKATDAAVAMARPGRLDTRVKAILEDHRSRRTTRGGATLGLVTLASLIVVIVGAAGPTIVQETDKASANLFGEPSKRADPQTDTQTDAKDDSWTESDAPALAVNNDHGAVAISGGGSQKAVSHNSTARHTGTHLSVTTPGKHPSETDTLNFEDVFSKEINNETESSLREAQTEINNARLESQRAIREANAELAKQGIHFDVTTLVNGAMASAQTGINKALTSQEFEKAILQMTREQLAKQQKNILQQVHKKPN